ncbi:hypothetical protein PR202_ga27764 [Eleusine coracana subsp. coracana]|uniref:Uncharacterized protein n=1 Tax=Eleusine coracana subsp. coracana TaxID=191504 RepID=A0AAV5DFL9_ELECO|nr:hypothetical protein PR202_ga27764 [Eleusine coracana subsp. coracana]
MGDSFGCSATGERLVSLLQEMETFKKPGLSWSSIPALHGTRHLGSETHPSIIQRQRATMRCITDVS